MVFCHLQVLVPERHGEKPQLPSHANVKAIAKKFALDACLDGTVTQVSLADNIIGASTGLLLHLSTLRLSNLLVLQENVAMVCNTADLVAGALQGFPVTVFAFGQTGSVGATHSKCIVQFHRLLS